MNPTLVGTGLRVLSNVGNFQTENQLTTSSVYIRRQLLIKIIVRAIYFIIVVDGANKWIGTADSGFLLVSPNGQETIYHFTP
jgi:hypothetical protein